jgi:hypothetical protein
LFVDEKRSSAGFTHYSGGFSWTVVLMFLEWNCLVQKKHTYSITTLYAQTRFRRIVGTPADFKTSGGKTALLNSIYYIYNYIYICIYFYTGVIQYECAYVHAYLCITIYASLTCFR